MFKYKNIIYGRVVQYGPFHEYPLHNFNGKFNSFRNGIVIENIIYIISYENTN